jgi:hypothetical protein
MKKLKHRHSALNLPTLRLEGHLLLPDQLEKAALGLAAHQSESDYHTPKGLKLKDDYSRAFQIACAQWKHFEGLLERKDSDAHSATVNFVHELLRDAFGYQQLQPGAPPTLDERQYPLTLQSGHVPVVIAPHNLGLDTPDERFAIAGSGSRRKSAFQLAQEYLNASPASLWALVSNGRQLRLLRDAATLTRPSYLEFDLQDMLGAQRYAEFAMAWRLLHASRAGGAQAEPATCIWERWRSAGQEEGTRVRDGLRNGVTEALLTLGRGFLQHRDNDALRQALQNGELDTKQYFDQLLRLIYRLIFLFTVEERGLLHPVDDSPAALAARRAYASGYALANLRELCLRRRARNQFADRWAALRIVFRGLAQGEARLALPALGGLFESDQCAALDQASLSNEALLLAVRHLRWADSKGSLTPVDYRNMGPEELGSVYESLLELVPEVDLPVRQFGFAGLTSEGSTQGNARKTTGSYYTPDSLVQELIKSALDPVIEQRIRDNPQHPAGALLGITVVDPACGSGHFLLAAARRLAERLAALRSLEGAVKPEDYRHALREVISHCIFGVDRNPMALELCRTALWLEGFEEGRPLSFLDHHLQCGDALLGLTDLGALAQGIPAAAFKALSGDDPNVCRELAKTNKQGLKALEALRDSPQLNLALEAAAGLHTLQALETLPEATPSDIAARAAAWQRFVDEARSSRLAHAADLLLGAFLLTKTDESITSIPTSQTLYLELCADSDSLQGSHNAQQQAQLQAARAACAEARVLHWPLAFPQVFHKGGFDCVLGNPPWEQLELKEEEFFATRNTLVLQARNKAERSQRIAWLAEGTLVSKLYPKQESDHPTSIKEKALYLEFLTVRRTAEAASAFAHVKEVEGGRYPLTGVGRVNTYALFSETIWQIVSLRGRAGIIVPSGIATDDSTKGFFSTIVKTRRLVSLFGFDNAKRLFPAVHPDTPFALITLGATNKEAEFAHYLLETGELNDERRRFTLSVQDFLQINPNTLTCPVFRSRRDAELTRKIHQRIPILVSEERNDAFEVNPWGIRFLQGTHNMSSDSHLFFREGGVERLALYEAKMIHQFDHRWSSYAQEDGKDLSIDVSMQQKQNPAFVVQPRYWVEEREVYLRLARLPEGLLKAVKEGNEKGQLLCLAHLLFAAWLRPRRQQGIYLAWRDFVAEHGFARGFAPTQLGLCGDNAPMLKPATMDDLPAEPVDQIDTGPLSTTAWYVVDPKALFAYQKAMEPYELLLKDCPPLRTQAEAETWMTELLRRASPQWLLGFRDITNATNERTVIASVLPLSAVGNQLPLMLTNSHPDSRVLSALVANLSALVLDFVARHKVGGTHLNYFLCKQLPVLPPESYSVSDLDFIAPRVLELTYTAHDLSAWAEELGYQGPPFAFDPERRVVLRAELDAWFARAYGLSRDELRYVLDPTDVEGMDYPSETFRVLQKNELNQYGEYRTQKLTLHEFDRMTLAISRGEEYLSLLEPPPGVPPEPIYSTHGILRSEHDARLAGLLAVLVQRASTLPRRRLLDAVGLLGQPDRLQPFVSTEEYARMLDYRQAWPGLFTAAARLGGDLHTWLRYLESLGLIRLDAKRDCCVAVAGAQWPQELLCDVSATGIAELLLQASQQVAVAPASNAADEDDESVKHV